VESSVVGYDGGRNEKDVERPVGRKKPRRKAEPSSKRRIAWPRWSGLRGKTVWDWLQLLIVPFMLAALGFWFTAQQDARQQQIEEQRAQDLALQGYLDQMSTLVLEDLDDPKVRTMLQARTLTVLRRLDSSHKTEVMRYLELPSIGWQLFVLGSSQSDSTASSALLDTYATRLLTEPLSRCRASTTTRRRKRPDHFTH
jgi:hypothetical protein